MFYQLEEARQIHSRFEKEFSCKNEETAQVVRKHQELLERLDEENAARTRLTLELHQARGERRLRAGRVCRGAPARDTWDGEALVEAFKAKRKAKIRQMA